MSIMLVVGLLLSLVVVPAVAAAPSTAAAYSRGALSRTELGMVPEALGKVTRAGKVAGIDAAVGDIVLPATAAAPDAFAGSATSAGRMATGRATAAAATVLHAEVLDATPVAAGPGGQPARIRTLLAMEENTAKQARAYFRARLVYGSGTDITWPTYHQAVALRVHRSDPDNSEADGCADANDFEHCTWTADPSDCRGPNPPCDVYQRVGTYRPKGNSPDYWLTEVRDYKFWHPAQNQWQGVAHCFSGTQPWLQGNWWRVGPNSSTVPGICPYPEGN